MAPRPPTRRIAKVALLVLGGACAHAGGASPPSSAALLPACGADILALEAEAFDGRSPVEARDSLVRAGLLREPALTLVAATVEPRVVNRGEYGRALIAVYPEELIEQGIGGQPIYSALVDADGRVADVRLMRSSGLAALDQGGDRALRTARFTPAVVGECRAPIWIAMPITFQVR